MIQLYPYTPADFPLLQDYFSEREIRQYTNRGYYVVTSLLGIYASQFLLLKENDTLLGCGVIRRKWSKQTRWIDDWLYAIWIHPDHRGKGYGQQLMTFLLNRLRQQGARTVFLVVKDTNTIAQNLYRKLGFLFFSQEKDNIILQYHLE